MAKLMEANARWRAANPEKARAQQRLDYVRHREARLAKNAVWSEENKEHHREISRDWARRNKEQVRERAFLREYGMTVAERDAMFAAQGFECAICGSETPKNKSGNWHTDHDHKTGKVRGILCGHCNQGLGHARDDPSILDLMAQYVRHHAR